MIAEAKPVRPRQWWDVHDRSECPKCGYWIPHLYMPEIRQWVICPKCWNNGKVIYTKKGGDA